MAADRILTGTLSVNWGDPPPGSGIDAPPPVFSITDNQYHTIPLEITADVLQASGGIMALSGKAVAVTVTNNSLSFTQELQQAGTPFQVTALRLLVPMEAKTKALPGPPDPADAVTGPQPWIFIMCKFADFAEPPNDLEPQSLEYVEDMYSTNYPGLDHYWRDVSYNTINLEGSAAVGWYVLPHNRSHYVKDNNEDGIDDFFDRAEAARHCTAAADPDVNFADFQGINLLFNHDLDGFAWGGNQFLSLDDTHKSWPLTWLPPWGYENLATISHEMGHGFGLPHSSADYGNAYDNVWDIMSSYWQYCDLARHPTYGCLAQHTIAYHKDFLSWIPGERKYIPPLNQFSTVHLERLANPQTDNYLMIEIPIQGSSNHFYTVEARHLAGYDVKLPGNGIIIHEVVTGRGRPAYVFDSDGDQDFDNGTMMSVGEQYSDAVNGISVTVDEESTTGYTVTVGLFAPPQVLSIHGIRGTGDTLLSEGAHRAPEPSKLRISYDQNVVDAPGNGDLNDVTNPANYLLYQAGPDQVTETLNCEDGITGDDIEIAITSVEYDELTFQATLDMGSLSSLPPGLYRLNICGAEGIENINSDKLDGDGNGEGGDDYRLAFEVIAADTDLDSIIDREDNCPLVANRDQADLDDDGQGNACDLDDDNDSIPDTEDNCRLTANTSQTDSDGNGIGDACEADADGDGIADSLDNCPLIANIDQTDSDGNGIGNACETDADGDGIADTLDNCPLIANTDQTDSDNNGIGDACTPEKSGITFPVRMKNGAFILIRL